MGTGVQQLAIEVMFQSFPNAGDLHKRIRDQNGTPFKEEVRPLVADMFLTSGVANSW